MSRRPRRIHTFSYGSRQIAQRRRQGIWSRIKRFTHEHTPRIDLDLLP